MEIKTFTPSQLQQFIASDEFETMPILPISTHRAMSHIYNPRVEEKDIILLVAYEGTEMIGYLGVLADVIYNDGVAVKCGWLSCMWVNPMLRGKGIAKQLLGTAFEKWDNQILVTEFTPEAKGLYDRSKNFSDWKINSGLRVYFRYNLNGVLTKKDNRYQSFSFLLKCVDTIANSFIDMKTAIQKTSNIQSKFYWKEIDFMDDITNSFIETFLVESFERRNKDDLNWILQNPWILQSVADEDSKRYHFSSVEKEFKNVCYTAIDENGLTKGFVFLSIRSGHLKIPYAYFYLKDIEEIVAHIYKIVWDNRVDRVTVFHPLLVAYLSNNSKFLLHKRIQKRPYILTNKLNDIFLQKSKIEIQDGDGDCAFT